MGCAVGVAVCARARLLLRRWGRLEECEGLFVKRVQGPDQTATRAGVGVQPGLVNQVLAQPQ